MEKGFFASLFDFSFQSFITTKLIPILYVLALISVVLTAIVLFARGGGGGIIGGILVLLFGVIYARVLMETIIVFFRIAEHTRDTAEALRSSAPAAPAPPSDAV